MPKGIHTRFGKAKGIHTRFGKPKQFILYPVAHSLSWRCACGAVRICILRSSNLHWRMRLRKAQNANLTFIQCLDLRLHGTINGNLTSIQCSALRCHGTIHANRTSIRRPQRQIPFTYIYICIHIHTIVQLYVPEPEPEPCLYVCMHACLFV